MFPGISRLFPCWRGAKVYSQIGLGTIAGFTFPPFWIRH